MVYTRSIIRKSHCKEYRSYIRSDTLKVTVIHTFTLVIFRKCVCVCWKQQGRPPQLLAVRLLAEANQCSRYSRKGMCHFFHLCMLLLRFSVVGCMYSARAHTHTHTQTSARTHAHTQTRTHTHKHARTHTHTNARAHTHTHTHTRLCNNWTFTILPSVYGSTSTVVLSAVTAVEAVVSCRSFLQARV